MAASLRSTEPNTRARQRVPIWVPGQLFTTSFLAALSGPKNFLTRKSHRPLGAVGSLPSPYKPKAQLPAPLVALSASCIGLLGMSAAFLGRNAFLLGFCTCIAREAVPGDQCCKRARMGNTQLPITELLFQCLLEGFSISLVNLLLIPWCPPNLFCPLVSSAVCCNITDILHLQHLPLFSFVTRMFADVFPSLPSFAA